MLQRFIKFRPTASKLAVTRPFSTQFDHTVVCQVTPDNHHGSLVLNLPFLKRAIETQNYNTFGELITEIQRDDDAYRGDVI